MRLRLVLIRVSLIRGFFCVLVFACINFAIGCSSQPTDGIASDGIELTFEFGGTQNGIVYDRANLETKISDSYVFPDNAIIEVSPGIKCIEIYIAKVLHYVGHPRVPPSIYDVRNAMGLAYQMKERQVIVATYGEWDSRFEGGAYIDLVIRLPEHVKYTTWTDLSGPDSQAAGERTYPSTDKPKVPWGASTHPNDDWVFIKTIPDSSMTAKAYIEN